MPSFQTQGSSNSTLFIESFIWFYQMNNVYNVCNLEMEHINLTIVCPLYNLMSRSTIHAQIDVKNCSFIPCPRGWVLDKPKIFVEMDGALLKIAYILQNFHLEKICWVLVWVGRIILHCIRVSRTFRDQTFF